MQKTELLQTMKQKAESVQAVVRFVRDTEEAFHYTADLTHKQGGKTVAAPGLESEDMNVLEGQCKSLGLQLLKKPMRKNLTEIHTAFTSADWGIAETGTLVLDSASEDIRIATMLAETHVAMVPASKIRTDIMSLEKELENMQKFHSRYIAFITGPSRTGDIEMVLTIGVHGPQEVHILIMEEE
ncbi:MAG: lactate utilization protein [Desulfobacterales bacterium]|nr:lactate utilization protein [Desulfobacterales bacterium]